MGVLHGLRVWPGVQLSEGCTVVDLKEPIAVSEHQHPSADADGSAACMAASCNGLLGESPDLVAAGRIEHDKESVVGGSAVAQTKQPAGHTAEPHARDGVASDGTCRARGLGRRRVCGNGRCWGSRPGSGAPSIIFGRFAAACQPDRVADALPQQIKQIIVGVGPGGRVPVPLVRKALGKAFIAHVALEATVLKAPVVFVVKVGPEPKV